MATTGETIRLERGEASRRVFWEITRARLTVTTRFGRHLSAGRTVIQRYASMAEASKAVERAVAEKMREGYAAPVARAKAGTMSKKGVRARDAALESAIEAAPDDVERYLVYADWLQQQGDVRGELIAIQQRLSESVDLREASALERDEATLFRDYEDELLGPLARLVTQRDSNRSYRTFSWRHGFIRTARIRRWERQNLVDLLEHRSGRFLERLAIPWTVGEGMFDGLSALVPSTLQVLLVGDRNFYGAPIELDSIWKAFPRARIVTLQGRIERLGAPDEPPIRTLRLRSADRATLEAVALHHWPELTRLHATFLDDRWVEGTEELLKRRTPALEHLSVRSWLYHPTEERLIAQDGLALGLVRLAGARGLARLDLEMPISNAGARALLVEQAFTAIGRVAIVPSLLDDVVRGALAERHPGIVWSEPPEEEALELEAIDVGPLRPLG